MLKKIALASLMIAAVACTPKDQVEKSKETTIESGTPKVTPQDSALSFSQKKVKSFKLDSDKAFYFNTEVTEESVDITIQELESMSKSTTGDLYLFINSPGGSVFAGNRLINYVENSSTKIHTVCVSLCASMAAHLHQSGATRLMVDNSMLMFHPAAGGARGQVENMLSLLNTIQVMVDRMDAKVTTRSKIDYKEFKAKVAFEYWVLAEDAVKTRLADGIVNITLKNQLKPFGESVDEIAKKRGIKIVSPLEGKKITPPTIVM